MMYNEKFWRETTANAAQKSPDPIAARQRVLTAKQLSAEEKKEIRGKFIQLYFALSWLYSLQGKTISGASDAAFAHMQTMFRAMKMKEPFNPAVHELNSMADKELEKSKDPARKRYDFVAPWVVHATPAEIEDSRKQTTAAVNKQRDDINKFAAKFQMTNQINPIAMQMMLQNQRA